MGRLFGTDGVRGVANEDLNCELAMQIGRSAAIVLTKKHNHKPKIVIGKDPRLSSDMLEACISAGLCSVGADVLSLGVVPTPAVAYLVGKYGADARIMISASHNPMEFDGIKIFDRDGFKLPDDVEDEIEELIASPEKLSVKTGADIGKIEYARTAVDDYIKHIASCVSGGFSGLKVALDCANGSASVSAKKLFEGLGASVLMLNDEPNGININENAGSTHIGVLSDFVGENHCHLGLAFDGDADRCLAVDENGDVVDGDKIIAICSKYMKEAGTLKGDTAVVTVMSNLGFFEFAENNGIHAEITAVGDRYVLEKMQAAGYNIGGEQSGHVIFLDDATTGDGQLTGVMLLQILADSKETLSSLAAVMNRYPQVLLNIKVSPEGKEAYNDESVQNLIKEYEEHFGKEGRILVRASGTEPLIRVMVEGKNFDEINDCALAISNLIKEKAAV